MPIISIFFGIVIRINFFARVFIEMGVPTWPNGCDIDPINAWMKLEAAGGLRPVTAAA